MHAGPSEQWLEALGSRIRERRIDLGLSLDKLADRTDLSKTGLWEIEHGRTEPRAGTLARLSHALQLSIDWIVTGEN